MSSLHNGYDPSSVVLDYYGCELEDWRVVEVFTED